MPSQTTVRKGRKSSGKNKGFWFRSGRGWYTSDNRPLRDAGGTHIKDRNAPAATLKAAYQKALTAAKDQAATLATVTVRQVCLAYLKHSKTHDKETTYKQRKRLLFDLCEGFAPRFMPEEGKEPQPSPSPADRLHAGYADRLAETLTQADVDDWCNAHPNWAKAGGRRAAIQAVRAALMHAVRNRQLTVNPIRGVKVAPPRMRVTYFTPDQEQALLAAARPPLKQFLAFSIRTGARPSEAARATAAHIQNDGQRALIRFSAEESKNKKPRTILLPIEARQMLVELAKQNPTGPLFRKADGHAWDQKSLKGAFRRLRRRLTKEGIALDRDATLYTCRHTFAKRVLGGYWTGKQTTVETLAGLMGNTREICWRHYAQWCDAYQDPLWEAIG